MYQIVDSGGTFDFNNGKKTYSVPAMDALGLDEYDELAKAVDSAQAGGSSFDIVRAVIAVIERHAEGSTKGLTVKQLADLAKAYIASIQDGATLGE